MSSQETAHGLPSSGSHGASALGSLGILEMLAEDPRPTFILDIKSGQNEPQRPPVVYRNAALLRRFALNDKISGIMLRHSDPDYVHFRDWQDDPLSFENYILKNRGIHFGGISWTAFTVQGQFRIVSGELQETQFVPPNSKSPQDSFSDIRAEGQERIVSDANQATAADIDSDTNSVLSSERYAFGCTDLSVPDMHFSKHIQFFRRVGWTSTVLGDLDDWPLQLHQMCNFLMSDPVPAFVLWGQELAVIYNEAAIQVLLERHPDCMGKPLQEIYPEVWGQISVLVQKVQKTGKAVRVENVPMFLTRCGRIDMCFFSFQYQPITDETGTVLGIYESFHDVTQQNHASRRLSLLLKISSCSAGAKDIKQFWVQLLHALDTSPALPWAMLYTAHNIEATEAFESDENMQSRPRCFKIEGQLGMPETHVAFVEHIDLSDTSRGYSAAIREATEIGNPVMLTREDGSLPEELVNDIDARGTKEPCNAVFVCPICPTGAASVVACLVLGLSPHLAADENVRDFVDIMSRQIATSVASVMLFDDEVRHREQVALQLDMRTKELLKSDAKFRRLADTSPVGIITADPLGSITYANQAFYDITAHPGTDGSRESWLDLFPDDVALKLMCQWLQLHQTREPIAVEHPLKKPWTRRIGSGETLHGSTWILLSAFVEENEDGMITGSVATISDISQQKWAEEYQKQRAEDAMELKRQQEAFVDMTSHEIRNPLSAMIQSADSISSSLTASHSNKGGMPGKLLVSKQLIKDCIDAADTITLCAQHQKRVIDDILTLSKLDSDMLVVTPVECAPLIVIQQVLKMFDSELKKHEILVSLDVEASFHDLNLFKVKLDPSRLTQVLVNILGNAIKFTQVATERRVTVKVGASVDEPADVNNGIEYLRGQKVTDKEACLANTSTRSSLCYLCIAVHDTGPGLNPIERQLLFKRFGQASPRTHVDYGGSGLGLFISKKLSELQGGAIGLASQPGRGSTFAFYVRIQRLITLERPSHTEKAGRVDSLGKITVPEHLPVELSSTEPSPPVLVPEGPMSLNSEIPQRKLAILVVEDNLVNQKVLCKQLRNLGHIVYAANHGKEALMFLEKSSYWVANGDTGKPLDIILLDTEMPVMDGLTCARRIRQLESQSSIKGHVPIISVTANARGEQIETATAAGVDDTISKPFRVADLTPKMDSLVQRYAS